MRLEGRQGQEEERAGLKGWRVVERGREPGKGQEQGWSGDGLAEFKLEPHGSVELWDQRLLGANYDCAGGASGK